jgi:hypothetical protein
MSRIAFAWAMFALMVAEGVAVLGAVDWFHCGASLVCAR